MSPALLIKDVCIFDGEREISSGSVLVENGLIKQVTEGSLAGLDASTIIVSKPGHTLVPGFIDGHVHADVDDDNSTLKQCLKFGLTTVCDMHQEAENISKLREQAAKDSDSADYKTASQAATVFGGWPTPAILAHDSSDETIARISAWPNIKSKADVDAFIQDRLNDKVDYVKLMHEDGNGLSMKPTLIPIELQRAIVESTHQNGLLAVAHAMSLKGTIEMLQVGVNGMVHTFFDRPPTKELIDAYLLNNAYCSPTLVTIASLTSEGLKEQQRYCQDPRVHKHLSDQSKKNLHRCMALSDSAAKVEYAYQSVRELKAAGIEIILGSDSAGPAHGTAFGLTAHQELAVLVKECGFTPKEALRAGTALVAKRLRLNDRGRIAEGLRADLVLVEGNPLQDIDHTLNIRGVWKKGTLCSAYKGITA
ncbi:uncharacterized protein F4817DRAFT_349017 [Daldinia loculata]|uniref:uncharacterized protein n=1 Tax=Daldinia loculata TaxID=103429 RepID=UPI0020C3F8B8|nr:uncharacterized protein F4817DRAFT_349017 [Daldinia loculata]KAI1643682.1 hypothetical protein F4817DRAFT_349017 [Daldinia loculata]